MRRMRTGLGVVGLVLAVAGPGGAQQAAEPPSRAEPGVVTATRIEEPLEQIGASVTIVPEEALEALTTSAAELSSLPGYGRLAVGGPAAAVLLSHDLFTCDPGELEVRGVMSAAGWVAVPTG